MTYAKEYEASLTDAEAFWLAQSADIDWYSKPTRGLDRSNAPIYRWFPDGELNTCYNMLDRHVAQGRGEQPALIWDSPVTGSTRQYTYSQLLDEVSTFAGGLARLGVGKGDRVLIYMPMVPEAVIATLATARIGAVHTIVFGGFAPKELAARIDDATPKVIVAASCGIEPSRVVEYMPIVNDALGMADFAPEKVVTMQRDSAPAELGAGDVDWHEVMSTAESVEPVAVASTDPLYILYTSGTTGKPKGVVRDNGGHAVALAYSMRAVYDVGPGDVWWTASDIGWVVGHSYIIYAPLLIGATTVMYEGKPIGTPDAGAFWRVISDYGVSALFTAPTALRSIRRMDPAGEQMARYNLGSLKTLFMAGERLDPDTYHWASEHLGVPVVDHWWQTETGWPVAANPMGLEQFALKPGSATLPVPGWDVCVLDPEGDVLPAGQNGSIAIRLPMPPGALSTLWNDDQRFVNDYLTRYEGYYLTGDGGYLDEDGYVFVMGRTDDVINVAGHRLSTGTIEEVVGAHPAVAECAVIGIHDDVKGQIPLALVVLNDGADIGEEQLRDELITAVRRDVGPVAAFKDIAIVSALPKTRSGKILRRTMRGMAGGKDEPVPSTIEDSSVLEPLRTVIGQKSR